MARPEAVLGGRTGAGPKAGPASAASAHCMMPGPQGRWREVRLWWRLVASPSEFVVLREVSGIVGPGLLASLALRGGEIRQGEVMVECLSSGRRRFAELEALAAWTEGPPPLDVSSAWGAADLARHRRAKFLADLVAVGRRGVRRGIIAPEGWRLLYDLAGDLAAPPR